MNVFVTGATGYIGRWLCRSLADSGFSVTAISRRPDERMRSVARWITADLSDIDLLRHLVSDCEFGFHLACMPMGHSDTDPVGAFEVNATGTVNLLQACLSVGVKGMVFTSTGQVYGGRQALPNREDQLPHPRGPYAASKYCAESWAQMFSEQFAFPVTTLRLFNVYGPSLDPDRERRTVENIFIEKLRKRQAPVITGNPASGRDFIYIEDVVTALLLAKEHLDGSKLLNIGSGKMTTLAELAHLQAKLLDVSLEPLIQNTGNDGPVCFEADIYEARNRIGFSAAVELEEGMRRLLDGL